MTDKIVVLVTAGSAEEAEKIATALVEKKLAACVTILNPVQSVYRWEGKVTSDAEILLIIKSSRWLVGRVCHEVENLHSYHVPEVICLPIIAGSQNYLNWLSDSLLPAPEGAVPLRLPLQKVKKTAPRKPANKKVSRRRKKTRKQKK